MTLIAVYFFNLLKKTLIFVSDLNFRYLDNEALRNTTYNLRSYLCD